MLMSKNVFITLNGKSVNLVTVQVLPQHVYIYKYYII